MDLSPDGLALAKQMTKEDEGFTRSLFYDTEGKLTGGWGHNFSDNGVSIKVGDFIFDEDFNYFVNILPTIFPWYNTLSDNRKVVILNMCFNLGLKRFQTFEKTIHYISVGDYEMAAREMLDSKWSQQVGDRASRLAKIMRTDKI